MAEETKIGTSENAIKNISDNYEYYEPVNNGITGDDIYQVRHTGFYYDAELNDPMMVMSLHPSTYKDEKSGEWKEYTKDGFRPFSGGSFVYSSYPIARCLLTEDQMFSINNRFTDWNGGNPIEDIFNTMKPYAPLFGTLSEGIKQAVGNDNTKYGGTISNWLNNAAPKVSKGLERASKILNSSLFVQGTRFSYYNGSDFSANNLEMKFTKFSDYCLTKEGNWKFINVKDYIIKVLAPYCYGEYLSATEENLKKFWGDEVNLGKLKDEVAEFVGLQTPPGGFEMSAKNLDKALKGTLRLNIGGTYAIENLVIKNMTFTLSKVQAKHPEIEGETVPLYAEITLSLAPACMVTDRSFLKMIEGAELSNLKTNLKKGLVKSLTTIKEDRKKEFEKIKLKNY